MIQGATPPLGSRATRRAGTAARLTPFTQRRWFRIPDTARAWRDSRSRSVGSSSVPCANAAFFVVVATRRAARPARAQGVVRRNGRSAAGRGGRGGAVGADREGTPAPQMRQQHAPQILDHRPGQACRDGHAADRPRGGVEGDGELSKLEHAGRYEERSPEASTLTGPTGHRGRLSDLCPGRTSLRLTSL
jgi:hypothetical protein